MARCTSSGGGSSSQKSGKAGSKKAGQGVGGDEADELVVAGDRLGAGVGETVLVAFGRAARTVLGSQDIAWQAAVVGIVDSISLQDGGTFELSDGGERVAR